MGLAKAGHATAFQKVLCFGLNEGECKFGQKCKFKYECSSCGGIHGASKCFKRGKPRVAVPKGGYSSAAGKDAGVSVSAGRQRDF